MLPLVDRPLLAYTFEHLARHGVERAIVSCGYLPDQIRGRRSATRYGGLALEYAVEDEPLGTGGAIGFAARGLEGSFFALNGDSLREADLGELVALPPLDGREGDDPADAGRRPEPLRARAARPRDGRVETFLEKPRPEEIDTDLINAGLYVLEPEVLDLVPAGRAVSIEREVFPRLAEPRARVYGIALPGYWLDVGTPESYLQAHRDVLERDLPDGGRRRARRRLHARRPDRRGPLRRAARPARVRRPGRGRRGRRAARAASPCSVPARSSAAARRRRERRRRRATPSSAAGSIVVGSIVGDDAAARRRRASVHNLAVVGPGAALGERQRPRPRPAHRRGPAHPRRGAPLLMSDAVPLRLPATGREALGLGARLGRDGATTSASCCSSAPARR